VLARCGGGGGCCCPAQAFLTGTLQNYARHHKLPIDTVVFTYQVMDALEPGCTTPPPEGCYIRGMHMEGARWDASTHCIGEARATAAAHHTPCALLDLS
jgi:dynein heavy chain